MWTEKGELRAKAFETEEVESEKESGAKWLERRIVVYSPAYGKSQREKFERSLEKAKQGLEDLLKRKQEKRIPKELAEVEANVQEILKKIGLKCCCTNF